MKVRADLKTQRTLTNVLIKLGYLSPQVLEQKYSEIVSMNAVTGFKPDTSLYVGVSFQLLLLFSSMLR